MCKKYFFILFQFVYILILQNKNLWTVSKHVRMVFMVILQLINVKYVNHNVWHVRLTYNVYHALGDIIYMNTNVL